MKQDYSLRSCDGVPNYFRLCSVAAILSDGHGALLGKRLCNDIASSEGTFTVMFNETTTVQNKKQMNILIPYWNKSEDLIVT